MNEHLIRDRLVDRGTRLFKAPKKFIKFTKHRGADTLLNNLVQYPHAFVLGCVMDRQIKAERAWMIPYRFQEKLGDFTMEILTVLSPADVREHMAKPEPLHHYDEKMARLFFSAVQRLTNKYKNQASLIWSDRPSSATVVYRFMEFDGIGPKIASMATNILARQFKVPFADYFSIDISADRHVRRVFGRLGLTPSNVTVDQLIFRARSLHPEFPGLMDFPVWEIGKSWCKKNKPNCTECYMKDLCLNASD